VTSEYSCGGNGVPVDLVETAKWWRLAAEHDNAEAQTLLALMYEDGAGVPKDLEQAIRWYRNAAEQGDEWAKSCLGHIEKQITRTRLGMDLGTGTKLRPAVRVEWLAILRNGHRKSALIQKG
jgi:TPR repeat protein